MKRIDSANVHLDLFGPGKHGFQGGNPALNLPATFFNKDWCNHIQEEICNVIEHTGESLDGAVYNQLLQAILKMVDSAVPVGAQIYVPFTSAPPGYLKANGAAISRTAYARLFARYGVTFGAGDGSTTFNLPDLRGEFIRGLDDGRGVDPGRVLGSFQQASRVIVDWYNSASGRDTIGNGGFSSAAADMEHGSIVDTYRQSEIRWIGSNGGFDQMVTAAGRVRVRNLPFLACVRY